MADSGCTCTNFSIHQSHLASTCLHFGLDWLPPFQAPVYVSGTSRCSTLPCCVVQDNPRYSTVLYYVLYAVSLSPLYLISPARSPFKLLKLASRRVHSATGCAGPLPNPALSAMDVELTLHSGCPPTTRQIQTSNFRNGSGLPCCCLLRCFTSLAPCEVRPELLLPWVELVRCTAQLFCYLLISRFENMRTVLNFSRISDSRILISWQYSAYSSAYALPCP